MGYLNQLTGAFGVGVLVIAAVVVVMVSLGLLALVVWFCAMVGWHTVEGCKKRAAEVELQPKWKHASKE